MKKLIIAEKPSVAADIARALGKAKKTDDYYENEEYIITSALGHLVELFMPDDIDKKLARWSFATLPIIPKKFELKPIEKSKAKLQSLKKLINRPDVDTLINACDAGREGELIFTYIYEITKCKKPRLRLWFSSMTPSAIRAAFDDLRTEEQMQPLQDAARCRSESDWLVGINGTRAITSRMFGSRGKALASVGRVQTPTLALIVDREREIQNFKPQDYWKLAVRFSVKNGEYEGLLQRADFVKSEKNPLDKADRIWDEDTAKRILEEVSAAGAGSASDKKTLSKQIAPRLYDLTTLQREANNRFSLPAARTLSIAQSLYEKHKMITYPRTDSRALPEDYRGVCRSTMLSLPEPYAQYAKRAVDEGYISKAGRRIFDNSQVSDHFALMPTEMQSGKLTEDERKIYDMIARRFVAAFYPEAQFDVTTRTTVCAGHSFKTEGKVLKYGGWRDVYGKDAPADNNSDGNDASTLPALSADPEDAKVAEASIKAERTKPPSRYTEATLLSAMEGAGKFVEDEDLAEALKEKGLGTPATRAQIIDTLINHKFVERQRRELVPTTTAENLISFLRELGVEDLTSPSMTGEWEHKLKLIEKNSLSREVFMNGISEMTTKIVEKARNFKESETGSKATDIISPTDGKPLLESFRAFRSQDGAIVVYKTMGNRKLSSDEVRELVCKGQVGPLDGFKSKLGKPYTATLKLDETNKVKFIFDNNRSAASGGDNGAEGAAIVEDFSNAPEVCVCPKYAHGFCTCQSAKIVEGSRVYQCYSKDEPGKKCSFRIYKTMLSHKITHEEIKSLAETGKTPLIEDFVSNRTKKKFSAFLVLNNKGEIGFEFIKRTFKKAAGKDKAPAKAKKVAASDEVETGDAPF